jgi:3-phenylpropionate/cinnamic acid dioxygenase small subunit
MSTSKELPPEPLYASIARLVFGYAERLDAGDLDGMAELFAKADVVTQGPDGPAVISGKKAVFDAFDGSVRRFADGTPATQHVTTNLIVDPGQELGTATARSYFTVLQSTEKLPLQVILAGSYQDSFILDDDGWRFAERRIRIERVGDLSEHLTVEINGAG